MYNKVLTVILIILGILALVAGGYVGYTYYKKYSINSSQEKAIEEFDNVIAIKVEDDEGEANGENEVVKPPINNPTPQNTDSSTTPPFSYKGYPVDGKIEIPAIGIKYLILKESTSAKAIEVSVVKIYGPELNQPGNYVIAGHNYNNGLFFSKNKNLKVGNKIYITDMQGNRVAYTIYNKYYTPSDDYAYLTKNTNGQTELTLYTCDATGDNRLVICARRD